MSKELQHTSLLDILPQNLLRDEQIKAAAQALDAELQKITAATKEALLLPRLDELPEAVIDLLAWQWHVDFYEPNMSLKTKRQLVRESIAWHRLKGTKAAVEKMVQAVFRGGVVTEWFEYGGEPYHFRVDILSAPQITAENTTRLLNVINASKNIRSWLDEITYRRDMQDSIHYTAAATLHTTYEINPIAARDADTTANLRAGGLPSVCTEYEVYPMSVQDTALSPHVVIGGTMAIHQVHEVTERS